MKRMSLMKPSSFGGSVRYAPHPGSVGKGGGERAVEARVCVWEFGPGYSPCTG